MGGFDEGQEEEKGEDGLGFGEGEGCESHGCCGRLLRLSDHLRLEKSDSTEVVGRSGRQRYYIRMGLLILGAEMAFKPV